jgi:D-3-phosphoglycerate dehydrogenase
MIRVLVTHPSDKLEQYFGARALELLRSLADVKLNPLAQELATDRLIELAADCDALIAYRQTPAPAALFSALPRLGAFLRCAVDIRTVDVPAASQHGVLVTQASPGFGPAVTEWILAAMVDLARGITGYASAYHRGELPLPEMGQQLCGATLGVIGHGVIGQRVASLGLALGMQVMVHTPESIDESDGRRAVGLDQLLSDSDFVVCLAPANAATENLMDARAFSNMRRGSYFINASRGELVNEEDLLSALNTNHLAGCALDVGRAPDQMPSPRLARHPRVLASPHIGGLTPQATEHQAMETVVQLQSLLRGVAPRGTVNADQAFRWKAWSQS